MAESSRKSGERMNEQPKVLTAAEEEASISRSMMKWINTYPDLPVNIANYEQLKADVSSMALSTIQAAAVVKRFITGGHQGEYQFKIVYRIKPGNSNDARLQADELLNAIGDWAANNYPTLGDNITVRKLEATTRSSLFAIYENGDEDHQILFRMLYEVI